MSKASQPGAKILRPHRLSSAVARRTVASIAARQFVLTSTRRTLLHLFWRRRSAAHKGGTLARSVKMAQWNGCQVDGTLMDFSSRRSAVMGTRGMVACSQPLAAEAGMRILQAGGNAADAAVATAAALNVTEPCSTGIGGDAFALFYKASAKTVDAVLGCGRSPAKMTLEEVRSRGITGLDLPSFSALTVTVPGAPALWEDVIRSFGKLSLKQVLQPAIELAEDGFPLSPVTAHYWGLGLVQIQRQGGPGVKSFCTKDGKAPKAGQLHRNPDLAATFRSVAENGALEGFYKGRIARSIVAALQERGSVMELDDLAAHRSTFTRPISTTYRGHRVYEIPPPTQGIAALMAMNILEHEDMSSVAWGSANHLHAGIEAMRLGFADALAYDADPEVVNVPTDDLLSKEYAKQRRAAFYNPEQAATVRPGDPEQERPDVGARRPGGDTVFFCVVDGEGNGCSFINSNYEGFGSGIVPEGCGFTLQNRGHNFILDAKHPNCVGPRKRPYHTIIPALATDPDGNLFATFGVMGGFMQPQGHLQVLSNMLDFGMEPQAALDAPRWSLSGVDSCMGPQSVEASTVLLEEGFSEEVAEELKRRGHLVTSDLGSFRHSVFGRGQIIRRNPESGVLWGGSDPRADGQVLGW